MLRRTCPLILSFCHKYRTLYIVGSSFLLLYGYSLYSMSERLPLCLLWLLFEMYWGLPPPCAPCAPPPCAGRAALHPACLQPAEVSMAIDEAHNSVSRLSPVNHTDCGRIEEDTQGRRKRRSQCGTEQHLDRPHVRNKHNRLVGVRLYQAFDNSTNTLLHSLEAFPSRRLDGSILFPALQLLSIFPSPSNDSTIAQALPRPKITLTQIIQRLYL